MDENINDRIRKFIIKHTVGKIGYSFDTQSFRLSLRQIRMEDRKLFRGEINKYEAWKTATDNDIDRFVDDVMRSVSLCAEPRNTACLSLFLDDLNVGTIVSLCEKDDRQGEFNLRLLFLGKDVAGARRFFVLSSNRTALAPEDILEPYGTNIWSIDHSVSFCVFRDGVRIPRDKDMVYMTYPLTHISIESPSIIHEVIDARNDFSFEEYTARQNDNRNFHLSYKCPSMALLMREYSVGMSFYADFEDDGINCFFSTNPNKKYTLDEKMTGVCDCKGNKGECSQLPTIESGRLRMDEETQILMLRKKVKC